MPRRKMPEPGPGAPGSVAEKNKKKRRRHRENVKAFPEDDKNKPVHLTAYLGYKAGFSEALREVDIPGSEERKTEVAFVTTIETPPMIVVGLVGYIATPKGLCAYKTVWAEHLSREFKRRLYKEWYYSITKASLKRQYESGKKDIEKDLSKINRYCSVVRIIAQSQMPLKYGRQKKMQIMEIQLNGGSVPEKVEWTRRRLEKPIPVQQVFDQDEVIHVIGVPSGNGLKRVTSRRYRKRLRKIHNGGEHNSESQPRCTVATVGVRQPSLAGKNVCHRTETNKKIYRIGQGVHTKGGRVVKNASTSTEWNQKEKAVIEMGGFLRDGVDHQDYLMIRGSVVGRKESILILRKAMLVQTK